MCDGNSSCLDCASVVNGDSRGDKCGTCDKNLSNDCREDCRGAWGGALHEDHCGVCNGTDACMGLGLADNTRPGERAGRGRLGFEQPFDTTVRTCSLNFGSPGQERVLKEWPARAPPPLS